jgi:hypothetical protein
MIKKLPLLFFAILFTFLFTNTSIAQQEINAPALTQVLPPAPNAFELTKYSGLPVNMSTGSVCTSIPLGTVSSGKVSLPISLSYNSGNGVQVNQMASRTGMSWVLKAGGVITRTVHDEPDESSTFLPPPDFSGPDLLPYLQSAADGSKNNDTQSDIFSFDFNGYSGQFILDPTDKTKVMMMPASNLKVETNFSGSTANKWTLKITDPEGTKYYFGGSNATEKSKTTPESAGGDGCGKSYNDYIPTAWYLIAIQRYTGEHISLHYFSSSFNYYTGVSQTSIKTPVGPQPTCPSGTCATKSLDQICATLLSNNGVFLESITSRYGKVDFDYIPRPDVTDDYLVYSVKFYKRGIIDSTVNTLYDTYNLTYITSTNNTFFNPKAGVVELTKRPFLKSVYRTGSGVQPEVHIMDYYNINGLASRLSFAQDSWGYFNNIDNTNLIPANNNALIANIFPGKNANRDADGNYGYFGLLRKITYPTGGADSLEYEGNTVWDTRTVPPPQITVYKTVTGTGFSGANTVTHPFTISVDQYVNLSMACVYSGQGIDDQIHQNLVVKLYLDTDPTHPIIDAQYKIGQSSIQNPFLYAGSYTLELTAHGEAATGNVSIKYQPPGTPITKNYQAGGVRLARNISLPQIGLPLIKKYIYASLAIQNQSSGLLRLNYGPDNYYSMQRDALTCSSPSAYCQYHVAYSDPVYSLTYYSGPHIMYRNVIELAGNNWDNGGIEHHYQGSAGSNASIVMGTAIPAVPLSNSGYPLGLEDLTTTFKKTGGTEGSYTVATVKKVSTTFKTDAALTKYVDTYVVRRNWIQPGNTSLDPYDVAKYTSFRLWIYPETITTTTYDPDGGNAIAVTVTDTYTNTNNLMVTQKVTTASDGDTQKVVYKYANEEVAAGVTDPYAAMVADNVIAPVIEQEYYNNSVFQQAVKTEYNDFYPHVYQPLHVQTKTSGSFENRVSLYSYTEYGDMTTCSRWPKQKTRSLPRYITKALKQGDMPILTIRIPANKVGMPITMLPFRRPQAIMSSVGSKKTAPNGSTIKSLISPAQASISHTSYILMIYVCTRPMRKWPLILTTH